MAKKVTGDQYIYNGPGYLDAKIQPVESVEDLNGILLRQRFIGLTVTVLHPDGPGSKAADYWLVQDPSEEEGILMWERKQQDTSVDIATHSDKYLVVSESGGTHYIDTTDFFDGLSGVTDDIAALKAKDEEHDAAITRIDEKDAEQDTLISGNTAAIEELKTREDAQDALISGLTSDIERIDAKDAEQDEAISGFTADIEELKTKDEEHDETISGLTSDIERIDAKDAEQDEAISGFTADIEELKTKDEEHDEAISGLTADVERIDEKDAEQDEELNRLGGLKIEKEVSGTSVFYYLVDGSGNTLGERIDVDEEQYLETVEYISAATEYDKEIDPTVIIGEPYLKFTWKYGIITYVAIKDWVNDYFAGNGIEINSAHEVSVKLAEVSEENLNKLTLGPEGLGLSIEIEINEEY